MEQVAWSDSQVIGMQPIPLGDGRTLRPVTKTSRLDGSYLWRTDDGIHVIASFAEAGHMVVTAMRPQGPILSDDDVEALMAALFAKGTVVFRERKEMTLVNIRGQQLVDVVYLNEVRDQEGVS